MALLPDGRWLAFQSIETGQSEVYVRPFPDVSGGKWKVSVVDGSRRLWAHSGRELFYIDAQEMLVAARMQLGSQVVVEDRQPLFSVSDYVHGSNHTDVDKTPDDSRFLMVRRIGAGEGAPEPMMVLVENWFEEVKQRLGTRSDHEVAPWPCRGCDNDPRESLTTATTAGPPQS